jgi:hypothetical protein
MSRRDRRARATGRKSERTYSYVQMLHAMLRDEGFMNLSPNAHKTLNYLSSQYSGNNNGDLDICEKNAKRRGLRMSAASLRRGAAELEKAGVIEKTRQGGRNRNNLYALSWREINYDPRKHDHVPTAQPTMRWLRQKSSSLVTQVESSVTQSSKTLHSANGTASSTMQSPSFSLPH